MYAHVLAQGEDSIGVLRAATIHEDAAEFHGDAGGPWRQLVQAATQPLDQGDPGNGFRHHELPGKRILLSRHRNEPGFW
jgi:hypothetical protein